MKKLTTILFFALVSFTPVMAAKPEINCAWLPGCKDAGTSSWTHNDGPIEAIVHLIWELIQYVAVLAVIVLMISGIMYLVSGWEEEKVKKAKTWIIWSLVWVLLSISAWTIITVINNIRITL